MEILHRVSFGGSIARHAALDTLGVPFHPPDNDLVRISWFDIAESHPRWEAVRDLIREWEAVDIVRTEFTEAERARAELLCMVPRWHFGYPQPEANFQYLTTTYDLRSHCRVCGVGKVQTSPFAMKSEPAWGKNKILQLHWVFDEFFTSPETWNEVFRPFGIEWTPVMDVRRGTPLKTIVQLKNDRTAEAPLSNTSSLDTQICDACGRAKLLPIVKGLFPQLSGPTRHAWCRTQERFGSGASAWNAVIVCAELFRAISTHRLHGVEFVPLEP